MVTHDPSAAAYGDRLVRIRDGLIEAIEDTGSRKGQRGFRQSALCNPPTAIRNP
jgi:ABC-type lipoprotein export system ATPase subunit